MRLARQLDEQVEFERGQVDLGVAAGDDVLRNVDRQIADLEHFAGLVGVLAHPRTDAGDELTRFERLGDVVVRAGFQAQHHVDGVGLGREHDDRHGGFLADLLADIHAAHAREHEVQQNQVRLVFTERGDRLEAVDDGLCFKPFSLQHDGQHLGDRGVIVHDEDFVRHL